MESISDFSKDKKSCRSCYRVFLPNALEQVGDAYYCQKCLDTPHTRVCNRCSDLFEIMLPSKQVLCLACEQRICGACKRPALHATSWLGRCYKVICQDCLTKRELYDEWTVTEKERIYQNERRARRYGNEGNLSFRAWLGTLEDFDWKCAYCQERAYELLEHYVPVTKGGDTTLRNCVPACGVCNRLKHHRHPDQVTTIPRTDMERVRIYLSTR